MMPWADKVPAIVQGWYQRQESGRASADVLLGYSNFSGNLPVTFPKLLSVNPAYHNWPRENLQVVYGEALCIGYRHYDRSQIIPRFVFGHGISYTSFEYGQLALTVTITNIGALCWL